MSAENIVDKQELKKIYKIVFFVSLATVLQISESLIPHPIPGIRLGLANVVTLISLVTLGFGPTLEIAVLRTILSSFIMGTFMSPTFVLSFSGAILSTLVMGLFYWLSRWNQHYRFSLVGISVIGALTHNITQLCLAYFLLIKHPGIFVFLPWLCIAAVIMGWLTGLVALNVSSKLAEPRVHLKTDKLFQRPKTGGSATGIDHYLPGTSFLHRMPARTKMAGLLLTAVIILGFTNFWLYLALFSGLAALVLLARISWTALLFRARKYAFLILSAFLFPALFLASGHVLYNFAWFRITTEGLQSGAFFGARILFLILANSLLIQTTSIEEMSSGLASLLAPFRIFGFSEKRIALIFSLSMAAIPIFWETASNCLKQTNLKKVRNISKLIPLLSTIIVTLYRETELSQTASPSVFSPGSEAIIDLNSACKDII